MAAHKNNILAVVFAVILLLHAFSNFVHAQEIITSARLPQYQCTLASDLHTLPALFVGLVGLQLSQGLL